MKRRTFLKRTGALAVAAGEALPSTARAQQQRPNVVWIVLDAARSHNFSCYGYDRETSPNLTRMAAEGVLCEEVYSQAFWTAPSVSCYMTGRYFPEWVVPSSIATETTLLHPPKDEILAPRAFRENGYATFLLSGNLAYLGKTSRLAQAFNEFKSAKKVSWPSWSTRDKPTKEVSFRELNRTLIPWIHARSKKSQPFFAYVHAVDTHHPYVIPLKQPYNQWLPNNYRGKFVRNFKATFPAGQKKDVTPEDREQLQGLYDGTILHADHYIGRLRAAIEEAGLKENTLVVVTSDHGESLFEDLKTHGHSGQPGFAGPDETNRVPLIMSGPGIPQGMRLKGPAESIDILPTLVDLCGIDAEGQLDGKSLVHAFSSDDAQIQRTMAFTKGDFHDVRGAPPKNREDMDRVFLKGDKAKCEWNRTFPEKSAVWKTPDRRAKRSPLPQQEKEKFLAEASSYFEKHLLPLESKAQDSIPPRMVIFSFGNRRLFSTPKELHTRLTNGTITERRTHTWITDNRRSDQAAFLAYPPMKGKTCQFKVTRAVYGEFRMLVELYSGAFEANMLGSSVDIKLDNGTFQRIETESGTATPSWEWVDYGPMHIKRHGLGLTLRATDRGFRIRRVVLFSDVPGALDLVKSKVIKDTRFTERQGARDEELEALGYL